MSEIFGKPAVAAIIEKIREYENIFDCLRREVWEETGLELIEIQGEKETMTCECNGYMVVSFNPFYSSQNMSGGYSIVVQTFICKAKGELLKQSDESVNIRWISVQDLEMLLEKDESKFYPMNINALKNMLKKRKSKYKFIMK